MNLNRLPSHIKQKLIKTRADVHDLELARDFFEHAEEQERLAAEQVEGQSNNYAD
jgi:hypothetical protein